MEIKALFNKTTLTIYFLTIQTSKDHTVKKMANMIKSNDDNFVPDIKSGFNRMLSDNYAFIGGSYYLDSMDSETRCQVYQVGEPLATVLNAVGLQKREIISSFNIRYLLFVISIRFKSYK